MSSLGLSAPDHDEPPVRRVREDVRDRVAVCVSTLAASTVLVLVVTVLSKVAG